jgi:hypothetical protein
MSIQRIVARTLAATFTLTLAGMAFAREPPSLVAERAAAAHRIACEGAQAEPSAGYRDVALRFETRTAASSAQVAGYRGKFVKSGTVETASIACAPTGPRLAASR